MLELKDVILNQDYEAKQDVVNAKQSLVLSTHAQTLFSQLQKSTKSVNLTRANTFFGNFKSRFEKDVENAKQGVVMSTYAHTLFTQLKKQTENERKACLCTLARTKKAKTVVAPTKKAKTIVTRTKKAKAIVARTKKANTIVERTKKAKAIVARTKKAKALFTRNKKAKTVVAPTKIAVAMPTKKHTIVMMPTTSVSKPMAVFTPVPRKLVAKPLVKKPVVVAKKPAVAKKNVAKKPVVAVVAKKVFSIATKKPALVVKKPLVAVDKKPVALVIRKPVVVVAKKPVAVIARKPVVAVAKKPVAVVARKPVVAVVVKKPVAVVARKPVVAVVVKKPVAVVARKPVVAVVPKKPVAVVARKPVAVVARKPVVAVVPKKPVAVVVKKPVVAIRMPFTFATATASGDPHTDTFDGPHHDTMVSGWFSYVKNDIVDIQGLTQLGCMPPSIPNTCLRSIVARITLPGGKSITVSWGSWPPAGRAGDQNVVIVDSSGKNINTPARSYRATTFLDLYKVEMRNGNLVLSPLPSAVADPQKAVSITIGTYFLAVTLPKIAPHLGRTNGLFGFFNGKKDYSSVFRNKDGSVSRITTKSLCQRGVGQCGWASQQKPEIIQWAMTHATRAPVVSANPLARRLVSLGDVDSHFVLPGFVPKVTTKKLLFCKKMLAGIKIAKKKYATQLNSCLQDADSPSVARSIAKVIRVARVQQKKVKKALRRVVKQRARKAQKMRLRQLREKLSAKSAKKVADTQNIVTIQMNFR